ncbi:MAG: cobalamin-dependent protein [Pseudomonadota bacterium]|nr:MAG: cobalamin-dependent protein [Pseudomonadota bacterium]
MRCALIIPAWQREEIFARETKGSQINYWQPLGILYVAAMLRQVGHEVRFYNGAFLTHAEIMQQIGEFKPRFAGIYSTTFGWPKALMTATELKRLDAGMFTCAGGPYPIAMQERCLADCVDVDAVCTGEGELTVPELVAHLESGRALDGVLGIAFRRDGEIRKNPPRPLIEDLDTLPFPARDLLHDPWSYQPPPGTYRHLPVTVLMTARGCDRNCLFCFQIDRKRRAGTRGVRFRSVDSVLAEIEHCLKLGYREIKILDDTLAADYDRALAIAREIKRRRLDFTWFASACVNQVDEPLLTAFREAGCWAILLGGESGVQKNLNTLRKGSTLEQIRAAVRAAKRAGLRVSMPFLFGIPGETYEEGLQTIDFALSLDLDLANFHAITPFPGTDLYDQAGKYGTISRDKRDFTYQSAAFVPYSMSRQQLHELRQLAFRRFYSRPVYLLRQLLRLRTVGDVRAAAFGVRSLFWLWARRGLFRRSRDRRMATPAAHGAAPDTPSPTPGRAAG